MVPSLLILTDFFQAANFALNYATNLAQPLGARLVLLHVCRDSVLDPDRLTGQLSNLDQEAIKVALNRLVQDLSVPVVAEIGHGRVTDAVADAVSRHHPALIVLGRPDTAGIPDELVSTTALDLLRTVPCPILVMPPHLHATRLPRRVALAVDGEPFSLGQHAQAMRHLLDVLQAKLTVLNVTNRAELPTRAALLQTVQPTILPPAAVQAIRTRNVVADSPAAGILQVAQSAQFDLMVLIARPRSFLGQLFHHSVTAQVLLHSTVPVLILPAED